MNRHPHIERAIKIAGSQPRLAERSGLSQQHISKLLNCERSITAEVAIAIEKGTGLAVPRWRLRPDLWDRPASAEQVVA